MDPLHSNVFCKDEILFYCKPPRCQNQMVSSVKEIALDKLQ